MDKLLVNFSIENRTFEIYGSFDVASTMDDIGEEYVYPVYHNLSAKEVVGKKSVEFTPDKTLWTGRKVNVEDMIEDVTKNFLFGNKLYTVHSWNPGLQQLLRGYEFNLVPGIMWIRRVLVGDDLYTLSLYTDKYLYYSCYDQIIMLSANDKMIISDNSFAEDSFEQSLEHIKDGSELLIWKNPKYYEDF